MMYQSGREELLLFLLLFADSLYRQPNRLCVARFQFAQIGDILHKTLLLLRDTIDRTEFPVTILATGFLVLSLGSVKDSEHVCIRIGHSLCG